MSAHRRQAHIDAPIEVVWDLVGNPPRHPEWWPRVIEVRGQHFEQGDEYAQVTKGPGSAQETQFLVERRDELRELRMRCMDTGMFADWQLTEALGGTFVEIEMGIQPTSTGLRVIDAITRGSFFRRWGEQSLDALQQAASQEAATNAGESL
jgi:uncharacterized protein YndB with AHSA1/START domain